MLTVTDIQRRVARHYGLPLDIMRSPSRCRKVSGPRQTAMYLAKTMTDCSWGQVARRFDRDHTTIIHGVRAVEQRLRTDTELRRSVDWLRFDLGRLA
jgi:chromosomal replication initiator protein